MKRSLFFIIPAVFAFNVGNVKALDIDEKLTLRFLKVSSTKKTVLINRGGEDGLVVGDHAKFFITAGVVARGVAEKVSPSRSVWSLYRVVDSAEITDDKVLNLKIASPVKITDDPTKSLKEEVIPGGADATITETSESGTAVTDDEQKELSEMGMEDAEVSTKTPTVSPKAAKTGSKKSTSKETTIVEDTPALGGTNRSKTWEVWGMLYVNSLNGTTETGDNTVTNTSTSATASTVDFSVGFEKYFLGFNNFARELSINIFAHKRTVENGDSIKFEADWFEYGFGANYHFYNSAASVNKLIGFGAFTFGKGDATLQAKNVVAGTDDSTPAEGVNTFFSAGVGAKYVLNNGFGIKVIFDYYKSTETYEYADFSDTRSLSGPRINFGLSYRF
ncbi:MAG: porin family protein [Bdellovibrionales bacterium]|nr:porin family protein [Bdellovibrionales bacterium]